MLKYFFKIKFIVAIVKIFLVVLGLSCCARVFSSCTERGCLLDVMGRLLIAMASFAAKYRLSGARASVVAACGLSRCIVRALESRLSSCGAQGSATPPHVESSQTRD